MQEAARAESGKHNMVDKHRYTVEEEGTKRHGQTPTDNNCFQWNHINVDSEGQGKGYAINHVV